MSWLRLPPAIGCALAFLALPAFSGEGDKVAVEVYAKGYFVKNKAPLPGNPAYLVLQDKKAFDEIFGVGVVMGAKPKFVGAKLFDGNLIISVIKAGNSITTYEVEQVRRDKGKLVVQYKAMDKGATSAQFRSPLIVSVPRGDYTEVVFLENGKEANKVAVKK
jgi:hypothetical protein